MSLKKIWSDPVWSKVISAGILALLGSLYATLSGSWGNVWHAAAVAWDYVTADVSVSRWVLTILCAWAVAVTALFILVCVRIASKSAAAEKDWRSYTSDKLFGMHWRWKLTSNGFPHDICTFCPNCDFQLYPHSDSAFAAIDAIRFTCDCGFQSRRFDESWPSLEDKVERTIQQRLRNDTWKASSADERQTAGRDA